jgi:DNA-binding response OmpR family regulator
MAMTGARILMVDDELEVCRIVERMLTNGRYQVEVSQSVADAIQAIEQRPFDLYVLDLNLRDGCGFEIAERIRSKRSRAPIILLSGCDPDSIALRAQELDILEIIEKPFSRGMIFHAVQKAIGSPEEAVT